MGNKRSSSRMMIMSSISGSLSGTLKKMASSLKVRSEGRRREPRIHLLTTTQFCSISQVSAPSASDEAGEEEWRPVPVEIFLRPDDMEARREGRDLTQRWGCYEPGEDGSVTTIQRKLTETKVGEFVFPEKPGMLPAV